MASCARLTNHSRGLCFGLDSHRALHAAFPRPECRVVHIACSSVCKSCHANSLRLQILKRPRDVKKALATATDDRDRCSSELRQVGGDVHTRLGAAVNASETAGCENFYICEVGKHNSTGNRCSAVERTPF